MNRILTLGFSVVLALTASEFGAQAQWNSAAVVASNATSTLSPIDHDFLAQANLGARFQIDSGRVAEQKATTANIRDYARLMVVTHIPVVDDLNAILQRKRITAPPETLL
jgi:putative membrane protein